MLSSSSSVWQLRNGYEWGGGGGGGDNSFDCCETDQ